MPRQAVRGVIFASGLKRDVFTAGNDIRELYAPQTSRARCAPSCMPDQAVCVTGASCVRGSPWCMCTQPLSPSMQVPRVLGHVQRVPGAPVPHAPGDHGGRQGRLPRRRLLPLHVLRPAHHDAAGALPTGLHQGWAPQTGEAQSMACCACGACFLPSPAVHCVCHFLHFGRQVHKVSCRYLQRSLLVARPICWARAITQKPRHA